MWFLDHVRTLYIVFVNPLATKQKILLIGSILEVVIASRFFGGVSRIGLFQAVDLASQQFVKHFSGQMLLSRPLIINELIAT